jgi:uncharacterized membrane protein
VKAQAVNNESGGVEDNMNYSYSRVAPLEPRAGSETTLASRKRENGFGHEKERRLVREIPAFRGSSAPASTRLSENEATFRRDGDFWTLSYEQKTVCLRDIKGLAYIAKLLSQPDTEIHSIELARMAEADGVSGEATTEAAELDNLGVHCGDLGNAGEMLDKQAKDAYRRRISELRDERVEAKALGQVDRAEAAEIEIDSLIAELSRATGLGGRSRVAASSSERARQSVTRAIKSALSRITDHHPALARILARLIKTGTYCSYQPDPNNTIRWTLSATNGDEVPSVADPSVVGSMTYSATRNSVLSLAEVLGLILEPSQNPGAEHQGEAARVSLDQIMPALRDAFFRLSTQLNPSESIAPTGNVILLAVNSPALLQSIGSRLVQS